jgi:hypothetical protein
MHVVDWIILAVVIVGVVSVLFGWDRYRGKRKTAGDGGAWQATSEAFIDPDTGRKMRVWYDPGSGQRDYRPE